MNVLIIEDDPMVDFIHRNYLEKTSFFDKIISSDSIKDANQKIISYKIDLVLLDIHIKDGNGMEFLEKLRREHLNCEVIIISAANDGKIIKSGFHLGIIDYLIKPFTYDRFQESIALFITHKEQLNHGPIQQSQIDQLRTNSQRNPSKENLLLEKGLSQSTLDLILASIDTIEEPFTIQSLSDASKLSHVSVRKYIAFMEENKQLSSQQIYTKVGRPYRVYSRL
ncbi:response regulator [Streptococcus didelphis]|uniref:Transcriptional regulatory protein n=1 Tax=Streptococcus didelphis TaxID=102886 RepID=A0ABY9LHK9_9STRE|nr:response regulator [Streptococcus didelphis]WMB28309.1 response regulator [Streptococcus didelphis]WMB28986.1 response regulator [Streptococcus didelphis]